LPPHACEARALYTEEYAMKERSGEPPRSEAPGARDAAASPGKTTLTSQLTVQQRAAAAPPAAGAVQDAAAAGIATPTTAMPHADRIQSSFGAAYDVSSIQAHVGGSATAACADMGASAFATGSHVAFAGAPDLHTAAHEAAHVVQQSQGVQLYGGVGVAGDAYERQADAVADRVVAGRSVGDLFGAQGAAAAPATGAVQKKPGDVTHEGKVSDGKVTARKDDLDPSDGTNNNYSLEYAGKNADKAHWLQFLTLTLYADTPTGKVYETTKVSTTGGADKAYSTDKVTHWSVDSASTSDPYYEAAGSNVRDPKKSTKIFDMPGGSSIAGVAAQMVTTKAPKATKVTFIMGFDTYLVIDDKAAYHVTWSATTEYDPVKKTTGSIIYGTGGGGAVAALPKNLKTALDAQYSGNKIQ
jgi:hypothetical protein